LLTVFLQLADIGREALDGLTLISLSKPARRVYRGWEIGIAGLKKGN
jgi:hypothetical protein